MVTEKYKRAYLKEYEAVKYGVYKDKSAYLTECLSMYKDKQDKEHIRNCLHIISLHDPDVLCFKEAFASESQALLNDALYQNASILHVRCFLDSTTDHGRNYRTAINALAAGMKDRVPLLLPKECGMCKNNHPIIICTTNLLMALWYQNHEFAEHARNISLRKIETKLAAVDNAEIRYLLALLDGNTSEAGVQLDLYCRSVARIQEDGVEKIDKMFWPRAHGLYNLAFFVLGNEKALSIPLPEPECFCTSFAEWQVTRAFTPGKLAIEYPAPLEIINKILQVTPPEVHLHQPYLNYKEELIAQGKDPNSYHIPGNIKQWCVDAKRFENEIIAKVLSSEQN